MEDGVVLDFVHNVLDALTIEGDSGVGVQFLVRELQLVPTELGHQLWLSFVDSVGENELPRLQLVLLIGPLPDMVVWAYPPVQPSVQADLPRQCDPNLDLEATSLILRLEGCLLYTSPSPRDRTRSRMPSSA
eukprot:TRINITY_DN575_c0_g1_i26.p1 TRINITY_DN575_c0_g1~~TRINITY_DN575_c0_g1_i26.p1  ORF type:complete len:132 (-),score=39.59 TRINITY_DN575_c0_g1_i26:22-417(-)